MKRQFTAARKFRLLFLCTVLLTALVVPNLYAAPLETQAGTSITNQATIDYQVGGNPQTTVLSDGDGDPLNGPPSATTFVVDRKVRVVVGLTSGATVTPGAAGYIAYTVQNDNNGAAALDIRLTFQAGLDGTEDDIDMNGVNVYWDDDGNGAYDGTEPGGANYVLSLARDASTTVFIVATAPLTAADNDTSLYHLIATAWDSGAGTPLAEDTDGDDPAVSEVVWADGAGTVPAPAGPDIAYDGRHSISGIFDIDSATLSATKTNSVISDPFGGTYRVPGATVEYTLGVANAGSTGATAVVITDQIPANTTFVGNFTAANSNGGATILREYATVAAPGAGDWTDYAGSPPADPSTVTWVRSTHSVVDATTGTAGMVFRVTIN